MKSESRPFSSMCGELICLWDALSTFVEVDGIEPTKRRRRVRVASCRAGAQRVVRYPERRRIRSEHLASLINHRHNHNGDFSPMNPLLIERIASIRMYGIVPKPRILLIGSFMG